MNKIYNEIRKLFISFIITLFCIGIYALSSYMYLIYIAPNIIEKIIKENNLVNFKNIADKEYNQFKEYIFPGIITMSSYKINKYEKILLEQVNPYGILLIKENLRTKKQFEIFKKEIESILKRKPVFFIDQEGGSVIRTGLLYVNKSYPAVYSFSYKKTKNLEKSKKLVYKNANIIAKDIKELGIDVNLAPVLDIQDENNRILGSRIFDRNPYNVKILSNEYIKAHKDNGVELCAKHFIGIGKCNVDTHKKKCVIEASLDELKNKDLIPFYNLKNVKYGMLSHAIYTAIDSENPAPFSKKVIDFIRKELKFKGILITDALHMKALNNYGSNKEKMLKAFDSGIDLILTMELAKSEYGLQIILDDLMKVKKELFIRSKKNNNLITINRNLYLN